MTNDWKRQRISLPGRSSLSTRTFSLALAAGLVGMGSAFLSCSAWKADHAADALQIVQVQSLTGGTTNCVVSATPSSAVQTSGTLDVYLPDESYPSADPFHRYIVRARSELAIFVSDDVRLGSIHNPVVPRCDDRLCSPDHQAPAFAVLAGRTGTSSGRQAAAPRSGHCHGEGRGKPRRHVHRKRTFRLYRRRLHGLPSRLVHGFVAARLPLPSRLPSLQRLVGRESLPGCAVRTRWPGRKHPLLRVHRRGWKSARRVPRRHTDQDLDRHLHRHIDVHQYLDGALTLACRAIDTLEASRLET